MLGADLLGVVQQVLAPAHLTLWLRDRVSSSAADLDDLTAGR